MFDEMTEQNASKFAVFLEYENPYSFFSFFISCYHFFPNECLGLCQHRPEQCSESIHGKIKLALKEKALPGFSYSNNMANYEPFARLFHQA